MFEAEEEEDDDEETSNNSQEQDRHQRLRIAALRDVILYARPVHADNAAVFTSDVRSFSFVFSRKLQIIIMKLNFFMRLSFPSVFLGRPRSNVF